MMSIVSIRAADGLVQIGSQETSLLIFIVGRLTIDGGNPLLFTQFFHLVSTCCLPMCLPVRLPVRLPVCLSVCRVCIIRVLTCACVSQERWLSQLVVRLITHRPPVTINLAPLIN